MSERVTNGAQVAEQEWKRQSGMVNLLSRLVREKPMGTVGLVLVILLFASGILADVISPYGMNEFTLSDRLEGYSSSHWLGADNVGRDVLSRIIYGARISMIVGVSATLLSTVISVAIGLTSGFIGGKTDLFIQRFVDAWLCFPGLVIYLTMMSIIGAGMLQVILVLGIGGGIGASRGSRALAFWIKESVYVEAARALGATTGRIVIKHLLPNVMPMVIIGFSMGIGGVILAEASLSFLGFGIPPPQPSWGGMLSGQARRYMYQAPWMALWPGVALTLAVYGVNMFGDALRDLIDPRLRGGIGGMGAYGSGRALKALKKLEAKKVRQGLRGQRIV